MNDRELLESAARAIGAVHQDHAKRKGIELIIHETATCPFWMIDGRHTGGWDALVDDGDALRLAATLGLDIQFHDDGVRISYWEMGVPVSGFSETYGDRLAATRRALVRTAAEIGKKVGAPLAREV